MANGLRYSETCHGCERPRRMGERFSPSGLCDDCGDEAMLENRRQLRAHDGPRFQHWRRRCLAALGGVPRPHRAD